MKLGLRVKRQKRDEINLDYGGDVREEQRKADKKAGSNNGIHWSARCQFLNLL